MDEWTVKRAINMQVIKKTNKSNMLPYLHFKHSPYTLTYLSHLTSY